MNGKGLYAIYRNLYAIQEDCEVGSWDELDDMDRRVWDALAEKVTQAADRDDV